MRGSLTQIIVFILGAFILMPRISRAEQKTTVGVDLTTLEGSFYDELDGLALEKRLVLRLVQEGFAVVAPSEQPDFLITIRRVPAGVVVEIRGPAGIRHSEISIDLDPLPEVHLEVAQKAVELVRGSAPPVATPAPQIPVVAAPRARVAGPSGPRRSEAAKASRSVSIEPSAGLDALWRGESVDALLRIGVRIGIGSSIGLQVSTGLAPSSESAIQVREWQLQAGPGYRRRLTQRIELGVTALVGILVQDYSLDDSTARDTDDGRIDVLATLPAQLEYWAGQGFGLALRIAPGLADEGRRHTRNGEVLWRRGALRLEAGVTATWSW
jgi:hypothetical protein